MKKQASQWLIHALWNVKKPRKIIGWIFFGEARNELISKETKYSRMEQVKFVEDSL